MIAVGLCILAIASWVAMFLLDRAGFGGTHGRPAILGGLVAGALLGPTLLGRVAPTVHEDLFVGARPERERWSAAIAEREAQRAAEQAAGIAPMDAAESPASGGEERVQSLEARWRRHAEEVRWPQHIAVLGAALAVLLTSAVRPPAPVEAGRAEPLPRTWALARSARLDAVLIGVWSAGVPVLALALLLWWQDVPVAAAGSLWAFACVCVGIWSLDESDRAIADDCEEHGSDLLRAAGMVASMVAAAMLVVAMGMGDGLAGWRPLMVWATAAALVGIGLGIGLGGLQGLMGQRAVAFVARWLLPPLAALAMVHVELLRDATLWILVITMLLAGDGRSVGAFVGAAMPGSRRGLRAARLSLVSAAAGPSQLALTALGALAGVLDPRILMALLLACGLMEATGSGRARIARRIRELEREEDDQGQI